jgi:hypothetical protein
MRARLAHPARTWLATVLVALALARSGVEDVAAAAPSCATRCGREFRGCRAASDPLARDTAGCRAARRRCRRCCEHRGPACTSTVAAPRQAAEHYVAQATLYFDTLDTRTDPAVVPDYAPLVARWELPPWLWLTGYGRDNMILTTRAALALDPSTVPDRDCRAFEVQPFARCVVSFSYAAGRCPIYEEFTFDDDGQITFIEAWSDLPGMRPTEDPADRWAEAPTVRRLSTRVPGLGSRSGAIDVDAPWTGRAAGHDPELADFVRRARDFWPAWVEALQQAGPDYFARGCGW